MDFRTIVNIPDPGFRITYEDKLFLIGSCFASNISTKLTSCKFRVTENPFGIVYNPLSIADTLERLASGRQFAEDETAHHNGLWVSFSHHGSFSSPDRDKALERMNASFLAGQRGLEEASVVVITLGTAWVYEYAKTGKVVNNCHKFPSSEFSRRRLGVGETVALFDGLFSSELYSGKRIILTVSPIRHLKDGLAENNASKATLILAAHELASKYENVYYFPAYEIVQDELRDYRFYARDMVHPSDVAVDCIWERFSGALISDESRKLMKRVGKITSAMSHRPLNPDTEQFQVFRMSMFKEVASLSAEYPCLDFAEEKEYFG